MPRTLFSNRLLFRIGVAMVVVAGAAEGVGAAADADGDDAAAGPSELRVVGVGADPDFLHRVGRRHEREAALAGAFAARVRRAVEQELVRSVDAAVDRDGVHAAVVERPGADALARELRRDARQRVGQRVRVAARQRQALDLGLVDHAGCASRSSSGAAASRRRPALLRSSRPSSQREVDAQAVARRGPRSPAPPARNWRA